MSVSLLLYYLGRFLLGAGFVVFGLRNIKSIPGLTAAMEKKGLLPQPRYWMTTGVGIQIVGGAMVALGILPWLGALALIAFLLLAAYLFHPFWEFPREEQTPHINATIMNVALSGAFLMVVVSGFVG
ncbi:MAG TPA: DoxX family protein [Alphaproteobacteria bacterium]|nr:DoxX family protein [Alphaproteobacteria bacterium]